MQRPLVFHITSTPFTRAAIVLLALLQFVAPTWHICELGGSTCCKPPTQAAPQKKSGDESCRKCNLHQTQGPIPTAQFLRAYHDDGFHGTCLARVLDSMPGGFLADPVMVAFADGRIAPARPVVFSPDLIPQRRSHVRGPPPVISL